MTPVFLHGLWRSGSTYIWSRFRACNETYCFYEPLHQGLGKITHDRIKRDTPEIIAGNAHPSMAQPYFSEYAPLIKRRGVTNYRSRLTAHNYILNPEDQDSALNEYLNTLIRYAVTKNKTAILGFNRTALRLGWLKNNIPSYNIHIDRDPRHVWASYQNHKEKGNYTFFEGWLSVLEKNADHPLFRPLAETLPLRSAWQQITTKPKRFYRPVLDNMSTEKTYSMVFYMWLISGIHALSYADMVIDMDQGGVSGYTEKLEKNIKNKCNIDISFSGMRSPAALGESNMPDWEAVEQKTLKQIPIKHIPLGRPLTEKGISVLARRKEKLIKDAITRL